ncbi:MAG: NIL domain-containing protein, partial [Oscillospiraceae bacterium]|nr:NIL domain-containing protein [Oscillospiraceae bacterium]
QSETAKKLVLPETKAVNEILGEKKIRIVFNGENSYKPVIANLILECRVPVNILHADTNDIDGKAFGQILIGLPNDEKSTERIKSYLKSTGIQFYDI